MDKFEFCKEHYFFEINRKHQLTNALALPVGLLTVLGGVLAYYLKYFVFSGDVISILYSTLLLVVLCFIGRTIYYLIRSYHNFTYGYIATPEVLLNYHQDLITYHVKNGNSISQADDDLHNHVLEQYSKYASENTWNNDSKSGYLHEANSNLIFSLILMLICSVPYLYLNNSGIDDIYKNKITNNESTQIKG